MTIVLRVRLVNILVRGTTSIIMMLATVAGMYPLLSNSMNYNHSSESDTKLPLPDYRYNSTRMLNSTDCDSGKCARG